MKVHRKSLEAHFGRSRVVNSIDLIALQEFVDKRAKDRGLTGPLSPVTIRKEVVTLRTVWNWAKHSKLVDSEFPARGLKYPSGVDQRIIDELVGHCTEQQRRRYRHLLPNKIKESVVSVFG
jgi:hypothetical protein